MLTKQAVRNTHTERRAAPVLTEAAGRRVEFDGICWNLDAQLGIDCRNPAHPGGGEGHLDRLGPGDSIPKCWEEFRSRPLC